MKEVLIIPLAVLLMVFAGYAIYTVTAEEENIKKTCDDLCDPYAVISAKQKRCICKSDQENKAEIKIPKE